MRLFCRACHNEVRRSTCQGTAMRPMYWCEKCGVDGLPPAVLDKSGARGARLRKRYFTEAEERSAIILGVDSVFFGVDRTTCSWWKTPLDQAVEPFRFSEKFNERVKELMEKALSP